MSLYVCVLCTVHSQSYGTVQRPDFSRCTWTHPQVVLEGCQVALLQDDVSCTSFSVACYYMNKNIVFHKELRLYSGNV
jgi:hypothetical protein